VGINDADYVTQPTIKGKRVCCPFYRAWKGMITRSYDSKVHIKRPTYIGTTVCLEWHTFSNFKLWMEYQDWENKDLDKDIINPRNKIYSPDTCCFVTPALNGLLLDNISKRGDLPIGVTRHKGTGKFQASCIGMSHKSKYLGLFITPEEATAAYIKYKTKIICYVAKKQTDSRISNGLILHAEILKQSSL